MQRDLAVGARAKLVPARDELVANAVVIVEFAVDDDANLPVPAGDRLLARLEIDDREFCLPHAQ